MSLLVWLPLNGNLENKGLSNITVTNNGTTVDNNGKIGKCYSFNASYISIPNIITTSTLTFSFSTWVYVTQYSSNYACVFASRTGTSGKGIALWITSSAIRLDDGEMWNVSYSFQLNTWTHITVTWSTFGKKVYVNGNLIGTKESVGTLANLRSTLRIGGDEQTGSTYLLKGKLNDFRIYDHCLSPKEVKEISKGLVLHYTLDDYSRNTLLPPGVELYDYILSSGTQYIDTGIYGYMNHKYQITWLPLNTNTGNSQVWGTRGDSSYTGRNMSITYVGSNQVIYWNSATSGAKYVTLGPLNTNKHTLIIEDGHLYYDNVDKGTSSGHNSNFSILHNLYLFGVNMNGSPYTVSSKVYEYYDYDSTGNLILHLLPCTYLGEPGMWDTVENKFHGNQGTDQFILGNKIATTYNNSIIYDCSGYNNYSSIIGTATSYSDTPRYNYSLYMNNTGTSNHIETNPIGISDNIFTVSFWIKADKSTKQVFVADPKIVIGMLNGLLYVVPTSSKPFTTTNFINNEWNHIVVIRNNTIYKAYINGMAETQSGGNNYYAHSVSKLWLLNRSTNNTYAANTSISDFRIYATALSDEDIKELYNTSAIIDNTGNLYGYLFEELSNNLFTLENWNEGSKSNVSYVNRNGSPSIPLNPSNFYYGSGDSRNRQFKNKFLPNTLYKFDLWIDTDSVVSNGANVNAGIYVAYTDGTNSAYSLVTKGNSTNPLGYVHKTYYSSANKTIDGLDLYYHSGIAAYYRWDSVIIPMSNDTKIEKNGTISDGLFRENYDISLMHKGGNSDNNQLIEI